jgi:hypothetical protein
VSKIADGRLLVVHAVPPWARYRTATAWERLMYDAEWGRRHGIQKVIPQ